MFLINGFRNSWHGRVPLRGPESSGSSGSGLGKSQPILAQVRASGRAREAISHPLTARARKIGQKIAQMIGMPRTIVSVLIYFFTVHAIASRTLSCSAVFDTVERIDSHSYESRFLAELQNHRGQTIDFSGLVIGLYSASRMPQLIRSLDQLPREDANLVIEILRRAHGVKATHRGAANGSFADFQNLNLLPNVKTVREVVEYGVFLFELKDGRKIPAFVTSSDKFEIRGNHLASALNGIMRNFNLSFSDIRSLRYFHNHPIPLPLSDGDHWFAESIQNNSGAVDVEVSAILDLAEDPIICTTQYPGAKSE